MTTVIYVKKSLRYNSRGKRLYGELHRFIGMKKFSVHKLEKGIEEHLKNCTIQRIIVRGLARRRNFHKAS